MKRGIFTAAGIVIFLVIGIFIQLGVKSSEELGIRSEELKSKEESSVKSEELEIKREEVKISEELGVRSEELKISEKPEKKSDWYVYVVGEVKKPGYYKISADSRIFAAIEAAGGFTQKADQNAINLAEFLADGMKIEVYAKGKAPARNITRRTPKPDPIVVLPQTTPSQSKKVNNSNSSLGLIDINTASAKDLEQLNGVGQAIAKRIVEYRNQHGKFSSPEGLLEVKGIGNAKLEKMRGQILIK